MHFNTKLVINANREANEAGDVVNPIHISTTYEQRFQKELRYFYGRGENPTREHLEKTLASLEDAKFGLCFSSGQAAGAAIGSLLVPGDIIVSSSDIYGGTHLLFKEFKQRGIDVKLSPLTSPTSVRRLLEQRVKVVWLETPTNPLLEVSDIHEISTICKEKGILLVVDNTLAGPVVQKPIHLGADISLYSTTKSIAGHCDVIGGALILNNEAVHQRLFEYRTATGGIPSPFDCYLIQRGLKTMAVRVEREVETATKIVHFLETHPRVEKVIFPSTHNGIQKEIVRKQMAFPGSIVSFYYEGNVERFLDKLRIFTVAVSLGGANSLIECPAKMTHRPVPEAHRKQLGITDNLIRISVGLEDFRDLMGDLDAAL
ncbi:aminotransferase class I/II-fold pyridoxal phosphate-dependent enzyme [Gluconacetobacter entanii]|uniref:trans-sulfuration enzyme family protein n=1 Tax=Gluconacetobacter entanii TaxID=108528 RepID=UPI001C934706|nr:aminotransferase class I/II-fold pyridoxal phosphate-dependent enzyme [Gluconacetobacter entanii]MBY4640946.1 aminotransferase class I/II-fold pyridoxal phosphate-dependent enzyme [Gluconacetobacter entanii]MCW4579043.1 aminotransferase class I/II-fold pyridoxal phosphate-dependent enzyme [Gluconacetobacter entanii]MCW4582443.1 aminotransferase class I/II-fold pyridoxal phosphate-dependent enzyme [Gluconacetobacter entanii]MCW4585826.1 aminotransferase class I/II-fold pyridoxal phosphate-dep